MHMRYTINARTPPLLTPPKDATSEKKNTKDEVGDKAATMAEPGTSPPTPPGKDPYSGKLNPENEARGKAPTR
ncbi:hypothetical protein Tco_0750168 [Tanacetum coccineum]|uniref:Uncharacterized protein n=1 Tax=Tanacetum coccineum TaxID=301880 RepID=A0ABQ4Z197_9ASTR